MRCGESLRCARCEGCGCVYRDWELRVVNRRWKREMDDGCPRRRSLREWWINKNTLLENTLLVTS